MALTTKKYYQQSPPTRSPTTGFIWEVEAARAFGISVEKAAKKEREVKNPKPGNIASSSPECNPNISIALNK